MSNKRLQVSPDAGTTWYTVPGSQAAKKVELNAVTDTIFGQPYESMNVTLGQSDLSGDAYFKGIAGYNATLMKTGTATTMTAEACSLVTGKTYQITNAAHRCISIVDALSVLDNAVDKTVQVQSIDYLTGTVTFLSSYTPTGPITMTGKYLPTSVLAKAKSWTLTQTAAEIDASCYDDAQASNGMRTFLPGLKTVKLAVNGIYNASNALVTQLQTRSLLYIVGDLEGASNAGMEIWRGMFRMADNNVQGNQGALEEEDTTFDLYSPDGALVAWPFSWYLNAGSKMNAAIQACINSWQNQTTINYRYLPTGVTGNTPMDGWTGQCIVTECSLANTVDGQNVFTFKLRNTGAITNV